MPDLHPHDLRHAAGTIFAQQGATTREIMARLGHRSRSAADRYQHAAARRDAELAARLDTATESARSKRSRGAG
jgi:integrase